MLAEEIKKFFKGDVLADDATLNTYSRDYSIFKVKPEVVVFPKDTDDIRNLISFVAKKATNTGDRKLSLTGRSAGTDMTGGPLNESIIVEFSKYFNHIKEISNNYAIVEPGVYFRDLETELKKRGLLYPPYPASKDLCALGGMIMNNSGGEKTLAYGKTEDYIEELKVVLSDGEEHTIKPLSANELRTKTSENNFEGNLYKKIYELIKNNYDAIQAAKPKVSKNSAGYFLWNVWDRKIFNLNKLLVGSQGTLGLITEAKLRLLWAKKYSRMAVVFLNDLGPLADLIVEILKFKPESLESYDDKTLGVALKFLPSIIKSMKGNLFKLIWQFLPETLMVLRGGLPKMVILAELTSDDEKELGARLSSLYDAIKKFAARRGGIKIRLLKNEAESEKYWTIRRQSFALLHNKTIGKDTAPFIDDVVVLPEHLPRFLPELNEVLDKYKKDLIYTIAGHPGDGNFHIIPLMDLKDARVRALIPKISEEVYDSVFKYDGSITAEHNDGIIRTPYLEKMYGKKITALFAEVKKIFDPLGIFNPGKKVGGSMGFMADHITPTQ